ncbi:MAG: ATP-binding protein [Bacillota bacterium]|nr:ATP-binding protein [Bacillota bacterium]
MLENKINFNNIFCNAPFFTIAIDKEGKVIYLSDNAFQILNLSKEDLKKGIVYNCLQELNLQHKNGDKINFHNSHLYDALHNGKKVKNEVIKYKKLNSEEQRFASIYSFPLMNGENIDGAVAIAIDITDDYLDKEQIKEEKQKFISISTELKAKCDVIEILRNREKEHLMYLKNIVNNISEGLIVLDKIGQFNFCNRSAFNITEFSSEQMVKFFNNDKSTITVYSEDNQEQDLQYIYANFIKKHLPINDLLLKINYIVGDKFKYIELNTTPVFKNNEFINTIVTIKDVTEVKLHEMQKEEQNKFIREVVNTIDLPIAVIECPDLKYSLINKHFEYILKCLNAKTHSNYEVLGKTMSSVFRDGIEEKLVSAVKECIETKDEIYISEYPIEDSLGNERFLKFNITPHKDNSNVISRVQVYGVDVTEEINHNKKLQEINSLKDEFFTVTSHELRTPLTIINSSIQLAYDIYATELTPNIDKTLKRINVNCSRLLKLVNNILDLSKAEAGFLHLNTSTFDIVNTTEFITESANSYAVTKGINLIFDTNEEEALVNMDRDKYEKILLNFLSNAIKYTPEGKTVLVTLDIDDSDIMLSVEDEGIGIPENKIGFIFERFTQLNSSLSRRAEGTGIGLPLVKNLIQIMEGNLSVESKVGQGTKFKVNFKRNLGQYDSMEKYVIADSNIDQRINIEFSDIN